MKKLFKLASLAFMAGAIVACSDELDSPSSPYEGSFDADGNGYVKVAINLPTTVSAGTRAEGNGYGEFNDGDINEYTVENVILCVFEGQKGESDLNAKMVTACLLDDAEWNKEPGNDQVTTTRTFIQKISAGTTPTTDLYGYVIVNHHEFFYFNEANGHLMFHSAKHGEQDKDLESMTVADLAKLDLKEAGRRYDASSFLMTNMPYVTKAGGNASTAPTVANGLKLHNVYPIPANAIYPSYKEAKEGTDLAEINVERVLAKVSVTMSDNTEHKFNFDGKDYKYEYLGWFVDNTNPCTYIARHSIEPGDTEAKYPYLAYQTPAAQGYTEHGLNPYRFISGNPVSATQPDVFRTFWAVDPNYNVNAFKLSSDEVLDENYILANEGGKVVNTNIMKWEGNENVTNGRLREFGSNYYCTENTFDVAHQSVSNTTRIVVATRFVDESNNPIDFYTIETEPDVMYISTELEKYFQNRILNRVSVSHWANDFLNASANAADYVKVTFKTADGESGKCTVTVDPILSVKSGDLQSGADAEKAKDAFNALIEDKHENTEDPEEITYEGHNNYLANNLVTYFHKGGVSYYAALIKHFGDYETPWSAAAHNGEPNYVADIYDGNDANPLGDPNKYLGRYGVVRNNWYNIDVQGIKSLGSAVVPVVPGKDPTDPIDPDTPDDQVENWLKVKVNITPWAIRKQSVTL